MEAEVKMGKKNKTGVWEGKKRRGREKRNGEKRRVQLLFTPRSFSARSHDNENDTGDSTDLIKTVNSFSMLITATRFARVYLNVH